MPFGPVVLGGKILISLTTEVVSDSIVGGSFLVDDVQVSVLRSLRPQLHGVVADMAVEVLNAPKGKTFGELSFWTNPDCRAPA